jgi:hypothetical protein
MIVECPRCNEGDERRLGMNACPLCECRFWVRPDGSLFIPEESRRITVPVASPVRRGEP